MEFLGWLGGKWFEILQTTSIVFGLFATAYSIRESTKERKIQNLFAVTAAHRDIWAKVFDKPALVRVLDDTASLAKAPVTNDEEIFVRMLILHLDATWKARRHRMEFDSDGTEKDIRQFFSLPIPRIIWERSKPFQDRDFIAFVEECFGPEARERGEVI